MFLLLFLSLCVIIIVFVAVCFWFVCLCPLVSSGVCVQRTKCFKKTWQDICKNTHALALYLSTAITGARLNKDDHRP